MEITIYNERVIQSDSGRVYTVTENMAMDICIIMDCMIPEALDEEYDDKTIDYNFVNYVFGQLDDLSDDIFLDYINEYEKTLTIRGYENDTEKRFEIYKGL